MPKASNKQARIEPIYEVDGIHHNVTGWNVVDETEPENEVIVSQHDNKKDAVQAAEAYEQRES
ncbi:hypothetical protein [Billgrantia gudaonensis]|uniref:Uncharacterized protein n=1 Tax=Billgrantia gudaonensis TaxID=376427 RepID=A0A1G8VW44_9GAMM|nr:hypothetical protein [Halomonas gudaonensis]SDJ69470.1 hypothetical protein SAMN04487954_10748 [Halomonas gudaonensis]